MIRRKPTRIELKFQDIEEYESFNKEQEEKKLPGQTEESSESNTDPKLDIKTKREIVQERIGYNPQPRVVT